MRFFSREVMAVVEEPCRELIARAETCSLPRNGLFGRRGERKNAQV
jgi:hypothetical protein